jgi:transcriptional regulator with XRE-family HTH domain
MPDFAEKLGRRIRILRSERQMSQTALAERINVTRSYLSKIERGKFNMRLDTMEEICRGLGIQPGELISGIKIENL